MSSRTPGPAWPGLSMCLPGASVFPSAELGSSFSNQSPPENFLGSGWRGFEHVWAEEVPGEHRQEACFLLVRCCFGNSLASCWRGCCIPWGNVREPPVPPPQQGLHKDFLREVMTGRARMAPCCRGRELVISELQMCGHPCIPRPLPEALEKMGPLCLGVYPAHAR